MDMRDLKPPPGQTLAHSADHSAPSPAAQSPSTSSSSPQLDSRHQRRVAFMQIVFSYSFYDVADPQLTELRTKLLDQHPDLTALTNQLSEIDQTIHQLAPERPIQQINKVDLAILRSIMFEWKTSQTPKKVLIDEAVELAKEFGTESSPRFVNGVLAQLLIEK
jgi:N utilization substance protein B